jgi:hypothetical protein
VCNIKYLPETLGDTDLAFFTGMDRMDRIKKSWAERRAAFPVALALLLLGGALVFASASAQSLAANITPAQKFDPEGEFDVIGDPPRGLTEVSAIQLLRDAKKSYLNSHSGLYTNRGVTYRFKTVNVTRERFTFTTIPIQGVSYTFTGRFLRGGVYAELDSDQWGKPILEGRLTKLRDGKRAASANLKFSYFGGT